MYSIYQRLFHYYITSEPYFTFNVEWFFIKTRLVGECGDEKLRYKSEIFKNWQTRLCDEGGYGSLHLTNAQIRRYFNKKEDDILFFVIFAHWLHFSKTEIKQLRKAKEWNDAENLTLSFITKPADTYFISMPDGTEMNAIRRGDTLLGADGKTYEIQ